MPTLKPNEIFANRYCLIRNTGTGGYSEVWLATDQMAGDLEIAIKVYAPGQGLDDQAIQIFRDEYKQVFYLNHPNLLKPTHFDIFDGRPYLILPFCSKGSVMKLTGQANEVTIAKMLMQIGGALEYLHNQEPPVIHRDIKPENVLVDNADNFYLCDFGITSKLQRTLTKSMGRSQESSGTVAFMAPELFQSKRQVLPESDIFSFGVMIYELITDELPFGQIGGAMLMNGAQVPDISDHCSAELAQIISQCLDLNPQKRPSASELKSKGKIFLETGNWAANIKEIRKTEQIPLNHIKPEQKPIPVNPPSINTYNPTNNYYTKPKKKFPYKILFILIPIFAIVSLYLFYTFFLNTPETVAKDYITYIANMDYVNAKTLVTEDSKATVDFIQKMSDEAFVEKNAEIQEVECSVNGNNAVCNCTIISGNESSHSSKTVTVNLKNIDGVWLVDQSIEELNIKTPEMVTEEYLTYISKMEFDKAKELVTEDSKATIDFLAQMSGMAGDEAKKAAKQKVIVNNMNCEINGSKAVCSCTVKTGRNIEKETVNLEIENGKWLVVQKKEEPVEEPPTDESNYDAPIENSYE